MFEHTTKLRVRSGETDQMGYVYYGNYAEFFEVARVDMLRSLGMTYRRMEEEGIMMPVMELKCKYLKPALYDEELTIKTIMDEMPAATIRFVYNIFNEKEELIHIGETTLVFVNMQTNRPCRGPKEFRDKMQPYFT
jgi:acyl-CoA thioester hydrolase